jgi:hypothetical protein
MTGWPQLPPPGWYPDPVGFGGSRWWDGTRWTEHATPPTSDWRRWILTSGAALRVNEVLLGLEGLGLVSIAGVVIFTLVAQRPVGGIGLVFGVGFPLIFPGQFWVIGLLNARRPKAAGGWRARLSAQMRVQRNPLTFFFGGLPKSLALVFGGLFLAGWLAAAVSAPTLMQGSPAGGTTTCPWLLSNHSVITCVSHATYQRAGAAEERFAAGVVMGFLGVHCGVLLGEVYRRRGERPART